MTDCSEPTAKRRRSSNRAAQILALSALFVTTTGIAAQETPAGSAGANAAAPAGLLTPFEERQHRSFVEAAASEPIDLLFLGDSAMEFWRQEGRAEWDRSFAGLNSANFGVQGATTRSVLWRLQNGELDGFAAKAIVFDAMWASDFTNGASEVEILAGNAAIVAEIRKRQPQANILLLAVPRPRFNSVQTALARQFAELADESSIQFVDVTTAFAGRDGRFNTALGSGRGNALSEEGYTIIAQAIRPKLTQLLNEG